MNFDVTSSFFQTGINKMVNVGATLGTTIRVAFEFNTVSNNATPANIVPGGGGVSFNGLGNLNYSIRNNTFNFTGSVSIGLNIFKGGGSTGTFAGTVANNTIGVSGVADSGSGPGASGLNVDSQGTGTSTIHVHNNDVYRYDEAGIRLNDVDGSSTFNAVLTDNSTSQPEPTAFAGLFVVAGADVGTDSSQVTNLQSGGGTGNLNDFSAGDPLNGALDAYLQNSAGQLRLSQGNSASTNVPTVFSNNNTPPATTLSTTDPGPPVIIVETSQFVRLIVQRINVLEDGNATVVYTFLRWGNTQSALTVTFSVAGTASFGTDYTQANLRPLPRRLER